ncbi:MAG: SDR family oxidoreductase [Eubacteriales bacterium]|nr:SDR family oxidoreductase [Eubacteriales bacterium]MDD4421870.1 SDR family oxidoreductase [Eubacteriales bacterium]
MKKIAVISGASSGIGLSAAAMFYNNGYVVYSLSRAKPEDNRILHIPTDVSNAQSVKDAVEAVITSEGRIDVLVNNAGFGISGPVELTDLSDAKSIFDVNFFGTFLCIKYALPYMRAQGYGHIVCVSSIAAVLPVPYQSFYSCTKSAINAFVLSLANEVRPFGIKVSAVMPGDVKTGFTSNRKKSVSDNENYRAHEQRAINRMEQDEQNGMSPEKVARRIFKAATKKRPRVIYAVGFSYRLFAVLQKILPAGFVNYIEGKIYG